MHLIYYSHSYRDTDVNEFFQELMTSEGMTPSLDPASDRLNSAKPERHLRATDGMVAVLPDRQPEPSPYILYEIALALRAHKPILVFVEDVLPSDIIPSGLLQRRFSRRSLLREVRDHRHAMRLLKAYMGEEPPPTYQPSPTQRTCLLIGESGLEARTRDAIAAYVQTLRYRPWFVGGDEGRISFDRLYAEQTIGAAVAVAFAEGLSLPEAYMLGAVRASLTPTIMLSANPAYAFVPRVPAEYQPRLVDVSDIGALCATIGKEFAVFEEDYLELKDNERVLRYRAAMLEESRTPGVYSDATRRTIVNVVAGSITGLDLSRDKVEVENVVGPVNVKSRLQSVTQMVGTLPTDSDRGRRLRALIEALKTALEPLVRSHPEDGERVALATEAVAREALRAAPSPAFLGLASAALRQAAEAVADVAPAVTRAIDAVLAFLEKPAN